MREYAVSRSSSDSFLGRYVLSVATQPMLLQRRAVTLVLGRFVDQILQLCEDIVALCAPDFAAVVAVVEGPHDARLDSLIVCTPADEHAVGEAPDDAMEHLRVFGEHFEHRVGRVALHERVEVGLEQACPECDVAQLDCALLAVRLVASVGHDGVTQSGGHCVCEVDTLVFGAERQAAAYAATWRLFQRTADAFQASVPAPGEGVVDAVEHTFGQLLRDRAVLDLAPVRCLLERVHDVGGPLLDAGDRP